MHLESVDGGFRITRIELDTEGGFDFDWSTQRAWKVTNPNVRNKVGTAVAYKLVPSAAVPPMMAR